MSGSISGHVFGTSNTGLLYSPALGTQQNLSVCSMVASSPISCASYTSSMLADTYQTCNAALVPTYGDAICVFSLTSAQLLAYDGTTATAIAAVSAPGAGRWIAPSVFARSQMEYLAGSTPYVCIPSCAASYFTADYGTNDLAGYVAWQPDFSQATDQVSLSFSNQSTSIVNFPSASLDLLRSGWY